MHLNMLLKRVQQKLHFYLVVLVGVGLSSVAYSSEKVKVICLSRAFSGENQWDWLREESGTFFKMTGHWFKLLGNPEFFLADQQSPETLGQLCRDQIQTMYGAKNRLIDIRIKNSYLSSHYEIKFPRLDRKSVLIQNYGDLETFFSIEFLEFMKKEISLRENTNLLTTVVQDMLREDEGVYHLAEDFTREGNQYQDPPMEWKSPEWSDRVDEFLKMHEGASDLQILSHHLNLMNGGLPRGITNSYIDFVTQVFLRSFKNPRITAKYFLNAMKTGKLEEHRLLAICKVMFVASALNGILQRFPSYSVEFNNDDQIQIYTNYLDTLKGMLGELKDFSRYVSSAEQGRQLEHIQSRLEQAVLNSLIVN